MIHDNSKTNNIKYKFIQQNRGTNFTNDESINDIKFYYQICTFPIQDSDKYHMRKFVVSNNNEFIAINDYYLSKKQCKKFFAIKKTNEYKCFPHYSLEQVTYPSTSDILMLKSDLLENDNSYSGYAAF